MRRRLSVTLALLLSSSVAACGNEREAAPQLSAEPSKRTAKHDYPDQGLALELPRNFSVNNTEPPGVFRATFGRATVAVFAYRRREQLPRDQKELKMALTRLEKAVKERSPGYVLSGSATLEVDGERALELLGRQTISQSRLRIRSLHVFKGKAEYVIELLAPPREFDRLDKPVFGLIRRTLDVTGEVRPADS